MIARNITIGLLAGAAMAAMAAGTVTAAQPAVHATATIVDISGAEIGVARFVQDANGKVHVNVKVDGLPAGKHGVHIHETGRCTNGAGAVDFNQAGGHYNPAVPPAVHAGHAGDLPNLVVNRALRGRLNSVTTRITLTDGPATLFDTTADKSGSAIIIHANEDDFGPILNGNSGGRIACGLIEAD